MGRIPIGPIIEGGKKAGRIIKENRKEITAAIGLVGAGRKLIKENTDKHPRKERYDHYKKILMELDSQNRNELYQEILDVEQYIQQIKNEENKDMRVKKPVHKKRIKKWNDILIQIKDKMYTKDYFEFIKIYNNPSYHSEYFKGFEGIVEKFEKLNNREKYDDLLEYIAEITNRSIEQIKKDFH